MSTSQRRVEDVCGCARWPRVVYDHIDVAASLRSCPLTRSSSSRTTLPVCALVFLLPDPSIFLDLPPSQPSTRCHLDSFLPLPPSNPSLTPRLASHPFIALSLRSAHLDEEEEVRVLALGRRTATRLDVLLLARVNSPVDGECKQRWDECVCVSVRELCEDEGERACVHSAGTNMATSRG